MILLWSDRLRRVPKHNRLRRVPKHNRLRRVPKHNRLRRRSTSGHCCSSTGVNVNQQTH
ncbi:hypothetical protein PN435_13175 [Nodularia spumigena CS-590/02]|uniref:hypothetical protein n=1 Tax=Nodularia spumigena TaxID=70799 RepID=UPI00232E7014|nr:hypothetical protein [Nodularia spumigena]MDB9320101.1 hypothetical protein [Nodularia spumigena CS-590/01A]MDB9327106.1 hypothetical protein [Nodularia spumigena CS-590/02]